MAATPPATAPRGSFAAWANNYSRLHLDLGTGDGAYVLRLARHDAGRGVVGIDTCLDHLRGSRRRYPANAHFVASDARSLPTDFTGRFASLSVNFPYGALLEAILAGDDRLLAEIARVSSHGATLDVIINASALATLHMNVPEGRARLARVGDALAGRGAKVTDLAGAEVRAYPSTWARRLGYGRHPHALRLRTTLRTRAGTGPSTGDAGRARLRVDPPMG